jgi:hypothetical protein
MFDSTSEFPTDALTKIAADFERTASMLHKGKLKEDIEARAKTVRKTVRQAIAAYQRDAA